MRGLIHLFRFKKRLISGGVMTNSSHTVVAAPVVLKTVYVDRWEKIAKIFTPDCCHIITIFTPAAWRGRTPRTG